MSFGKLHEQFSKFSSEQLKTSKLVSFSSKYKIHELRDYTGVKSNDTEG